MLKLIATCDHEGCGATEEVEPAGAVSAIPVPSAWEWEHTIEGYKLRCPAHARDLSDDDREQLAEGASGPQPPSVQSDNGLLSARRKSRGSSAEGYPACPECLSGKHDPFHSPGCPVVARIMRDRATARAEA